MTMLAFQNVVDSAVEASVAPHAARVLNVDHNLIEITRTDTLSIEESRATC
jgi:hypothetical protein